MADTKAEEELFWTMDEGGPNGDTAALTIKQGDRYYNFFGDDVYIIGELILKAQNQLLDELEKAMESEGVKLGSRKELFTHKSTVMELIKGKRAELRVEHVEKE